MRNLTKTLMAVALIFVVASCGNSTQKSDSNENAAKETTNTIINSDNSMTKTIKLTRADFLTKVANYEANPEKWEYLGDKPCIIDFYARASKMNGAYSTTDA